MTKEETENAIKVMQAYVDGKQIEYCELREKNGDFVIILFLIGMLLIIAFLKTHSIVLFKIH